MTTSDLKAMIKVVHIRTLVKVVIRFKSKKVTNFSIV
jgi:hypothetical protein